MDKNDREDVLEFYNEYIEDADLQERAAIEKKLGTPKQLSRMILADYSIKTNDREGETKTASPLSNWQVFCWVLLTIVSSPLLFGVGIGAFVLLIVAFALCFGIVVGLIGSLIGFIGMAVVSIYTGILLLGQQPFVGIFYGGIGLIYIGLIMIGIPIAYWVICWLSQLVACLAKYLYRKLQVRREK